MDQTRTPDLRSGGALCEIGGQCGVGFLNAMLAEEPDDEEMAEFARSAFRRGGLPGLFSMCCCLAAMAVPDGAHVSALVLERRDGLRFTRAHDDNPYVTAVQFLTAVSNDDLDMAWALFLALFPWGDPPYKVEQARFVFILGRIARSTILQEMGVDE